VALLPQREEYCGSDLACRDARPAAARQGGRRLPLRQGPEWPRGIAWRLFTIRAKRQRWLGPRKPLHRSAVIRGFELEGMMNDRRLTILLIVAAGMGLAAGRLLWGPPIFGRGGGSGADLRPVGSTGTAGRWAAEVPIEAVAAERRVVLPVSRLPSSGGKTEPRRLLGQGHSERDLWSFVEKARRRSVPEPPAGTMPLAPPALLASSSAGSSPSASDARADGAPLPWIYLGRFGPRQRPIAVFIDRELREAVRAVRQGDALASGLVVDWIGLESVDVRRVGSPGRPSVRMAAGK
jgi:hypothetical protein